MPFDRASILRDAHAQARRLLTWSCFKGTYRQAFAAGLALAWQTAKAEREEAEWLAAQPPITARGNLLHAAMLACALDLEEAACAAR